MNATQLVKALSKLPPDAPITLACGESKYRGTSMEKVYYFKSRFVGNKTAIIIKYNSRKQYEKDPIKGLTIQSLLKKLEMVDPNAKIFATGWGECLCEVGSVEMLELTYFDKMIGHINRANAARLFGCGGGCI